MCGENMDTEKTLHIHAEQMGSATDRVESPLSSRDDVLHGFQTDLDNLPAGYYRSSFFLGTMFAVGIGLTAAVGGFGLAAPALALINSEIGPDPNINWVSFVYTLTLSISLLLVGRMSDLFGYPVLLFHCFVWANTFAVDDGSSSLEPASQSLVPLFQLLLRTCRHLLVVLPSLALEQVPNNHSPLCPMNWFQ
jgi:Fungal trichothecene efflux pump (TRI12)